MAKESTMVSSNNRRVLFSSWVDLFTVSRLEFLLLCLLVLVGAIYLWNPLKWGPAYIGLNQYGDAEFWWNGAVHLSKGIFDNNPGKGFRPGYFILTGQSLAILGTDFSLFHKYFLVLFFSALSFFYIALRQSLGKLGAGIGIALVVLNPFTAEWVSTTTTDATGFILNVLALSCLMIGIKGPLFRKRWFGAFGLLFSLGTLTRPLVTPYIGVVLFYVAFFLSAPFRVRIKILGTVVLTFLLPALLWMCVQKITINEWSISTNDASAFYGASDPSIQVWNGEMYKKIENLASVRNHIHSPTVPQINQEFWLQTVENYKKYWRYHLHRVIPHLKVLAKFGPELSSHPHPNLRRVVLLIFCTGIFLASCLNRNFLVASIALLAGIGIRYLGVLPLLLFFGLIISLLNLFDKKSTKNGDAFLLASYWLIGSLALFLVGGTWGDPFGPASVSLNALGYRLGMQFFFVGDLLILFCLQRLFNSCGDMGALLPVSKWIISDRGVSKILAFVLAGVLTVSSLIQLGGTLIVAQQNYARRVAIRVPYPSLDDLKFKLSSLGLLARSDHLETGATSDFLWTLKGQDRSQILYYTESYAFPFEMHPNRKIIEVSKGTLEDAWKFRQGAYVFKDFKDIPAKSNLPYYLSAPILRAFFPLAKDRKTFNLDEAEWFPVAKYASLLSASRELRNDASSLIWESDSGSAPYKRRFTLKPINGNNEVKLSVALGNAVGKRRITFEWAPDLSNVFLLKGEGETPRVRIFLNYLHKRTVSYEESFRAGLKMETINLDDPALKSVGFTFLHVPIEGIKVYEFNLVADNFLNE